MTNDKEKKVDTNGKEESSCRENPYLQGNDRIEAMIHELVEEPSQDGMLDLMDLLLERMQEDGHLLLPVDRNLQETDEDGMPSYKLRTLTLEDGEEVLVAFTREEESRRSMDTQIISNYMEPFFRVAAENETTCGLVINPWGESVYIPRELLQMLFEEGEEYESMVKFELGDITQLDVECIVNAANSSLLGGGGVDGAIHRAAGPDLLRECRTLGGCATGEAKITRGYRLPADYVIHTVGPIYSGSSRDPLLLASCYRNSLNLAREYGIRSIAFPAISTGVYGYPPIEAAGIALQTVFDWMDENVDYPITVVFCSFDQYTYDIYQDYIRENEE